MKLIHRVLILAAIVITMSISVPLLAWNSNVTKEVRVGKVSAVGEAKLAQSGAQAVQNEAQAVRIQLGDVATVGGSSLSEGQAIKLASLIVEAGKSTAIGLVELA